MRCWGIRGVVGCVFGAFELAATSDVTRGHKMKTTRLQRPVVHGELLARLPPKASFPSLPSPSPPVCCPLLVPQESCHLCLEVLCYLISQPSLVSGTAPPPLTLARFLSVPHTVCCLGPLLLNPWQMFVH